MEKVHERIQKLVKNPLLGFVRRPLDFARHRLANALLWILEPQAKVLSSHLVGRHLLKDRKFLELLKSRLESLDLEKGLFGEAKICEHRNELLALAIEQAKHLKEKGLWLEFGVWRGNSVNVIARSVPWTVYGFDSFEGLPETWTIGRYMCAKKGKRHMHDKLPVVINNVELVKGWFEQTLPDFIAKHPEPVSFVHIDSDLYSSAKCILGHLNFQDGSVVVFDEYFNYPFWREGEYKAFQEFLATRQATSTCIGYCPKSGQAGFILHFQKKLNPVIA